MKNKQEASMVRRYFKAYLSLIGIIAAFVGVSVAQGAGWRPALAGMPVYVIVFAGITYQLIKEIVKLKKQERERQVSAEIKEH
jgi:membrane protein implicated in regulation of membrane protease activity